MIEAKEGVSSRAKRSRTKPLAAVTYLLRNAKQTVPLVGVITLAVMLIAGIVTLINSIPLSVRTIYSYSEYMFAMRPRGMEQINKDFSQRVRDGSPVPLERIITCRASGAEVKSIVGNWPFIVLGLSPEDMRYFMARMDTRSVRGRLPAEGAPEALVSQPVAQNLNLRLGDILLKPEDQDYYSPREVKVVGIADSDQWYIVNDIGYQRRHHFPPIENVLVFAHNLRDQKLLDAWAMKEFQGEQMQLFAYDEIEQDSEEMFRILYRILDVVIGTLVIVITIMMGMLINIYQSQRLVEFGLLQALGYTKKQLVRRVIGETALVLVFGWLLGLLVAFGLLNIVNATLMQPQAFALNPLDPIGLRYTLPIPIAIMLVAVYTVWRRFRKFDPVSVVERRLV